MRGWGLGDVARCPVAGLRRPRLRPVGREGSSAPWVRWRQMCKRAPRLGRASKRTADARSKFSETFLLFRAVRGAGHRWLGAPAIGTCSPTRRCGAAKPPAGASTRCHRAAVVSSGSRSVRRDAGERVGACARTEPAVAGRPYAFARHRADRPGSFSGRAGAAGLDGGGRGCAAARPVGRQGRFTLDRDHQRADQLRGKALTQNQPHMPLPQVLRSVVRCRSAVGGWLASPSVARSGALLAVARRRVSANSGRPVEC